MRPSSIAARLAAAALLAPAVLATPVAAQAPAAGGATAARADAAVAGVMPKVIAWRRDIHQHPELSNRETRTAGLVAEHLKKLGLEVRTGVAKTGVVGVLKGGRPVQRSRCAPTWTRSR